ncbi:MAG: hypothetical protein SFV22_10460, partial [Saprospiraceae bacterium]|nr:hypothetical protein [Saprospiraceae bacterium]
PQNIIGTIQTNNDSVELKGKIIVQKLGVERINNGSIEKFTDEVTIVFDKDAVESLFPDGICNLVLKPNLFSTIEWESSSNELSGSEAETKDQPAHVILSKIVTFINEDGVEEEIEVYFLPGKRKECTFPLFVKEAKDGDWHFLHNLHKTNAGIDPILKKDEKLQVRLVKGKELVNEVERFIKRYKKEHPTTDDEAPEYVSELISALKKEENVANYIKNAYGITKYDKDKSEFFEITADKIDTKLKTLILVPGTFKKSIEGIRFIDGSVKWEGSFKYLMGRYKRKRQNWFDFLLTKGVSEYEQIISLEHDSTIDSLEDNINYFIHHLGIGTLKFDKPTAILSASRGGFLAKKLALIGDGQDSKFSPPPLNLNIEKIITVANGTSGYLDSAKPDVLKQRLSFFLGIMGFAKFGFEGQFLWLHSLMPSHLMQLPGLASQSKRSQDVKAINEDSETISGLWCLPLAYKKYPFKISLLEDILFIRIADFLGPENDLVLSFDSQKNYRPGNLAKEFGIFEGKAIHGDGLDNEEAKQRIIDFLNAKLLDTTLTQPSEPILP